jgi:hypothetical protein
MARMLCQAGARPRLLLRDLDRVDADLRDRVELAVGDQRDADYVARPLEDPMPWVDPRTSPSWQPAACSPTAGPAARCRW